MQPGKKATLWRLFPAGVFTAPILALRGCLARGCMWRSPRNGRSSGEHMAVPCGLLSSCMTRPWNNGAGLHENFQNGNAGRAVRLTGAAQEATIELFVDRFGILDEAVSQVFQQRELSAGHVGFHHGFAENRAHGLAHAAFHAGGELVVKRHEGVGEEGQLIHDLNSNQLAGVEQALRVDGLAQAARVPDGAA